MSTSEEPIVELDSRLLAESLAPTLLQACDQRLEELVWFRTDWQRGGAATATARWTQDDGTTVPVVVKLPVGQRELLWTRRLQREDETDPVVPRLYASGALLGDYDLAWLVIERFEHGPLGLRWHEGHVGRIADAVARFQAVAASFPVDQPPRVEDWDRQVADARTRARTGGLAEQSRWMAALKRLSSRLDEIVTRWRARPIDDWLHGDAHIANAMSRHGLEEGTVSLIDLAEVRAGHWIEDAVYLERQLWATPDRMKPLRPVKAIAEARRRLGLAVDPDYPRLATVRRVLLAATAPRYIKS
ncbi:MAG: phosphotransferase family protein, partial [Planctomycetota bacterium]